MLTPDEPRHSGTGMASSILGLIACALVGVFAVILLVGMIRAGNLRSLFDMILSWTGFVWISCLLALVLPTSLAGAGLGLVSVFGQPGKKHLFSWIGLASNGLAFLVVAVLFLVSLLQDVIR